MRGTARVSATIGVEQNSPMLTPLTPNRVPSAATARSQLATSWQPAAVAIPCTSAITGCGSRVIASITRLHRSKSARNRASPPSSACRASVISLRSCPAQNARPAPFRITTRISLSPASSPSSASSACSIASDSAFNLPGLFSVSVATAPSSSRSRMSSSTVAPSLAVRPRACHLAQVPTPRESPSMQLHFTIPEMHAYLAEVFPQLGPRFEVLELRPAFVKVRMIDRSRPTSAPAAPSPARRSSPSPTAPSTSPPSRSSAARRSP